MDLIKASFKDISAAVRSRKLSAVEVTQFFLTRIDEKNKKLNAFIHVNENALKEAVQIDQKIKSGFAGKLAGIPWGIKDMFCTKNMPTTAASKILKNFIPPYDATVVQKLKSEGAIILGKLNQDEFAMGSSNETSIFGPSRNPWNIDCSTGGSSGGSAAAQSARLCAGATGTDTGGSIRQPANFCGVVGVKPTYGRISRYGIIAYASSLDQAGPFATYVEDAALALEIMCGHDTKDATSSQQKVPAFSEKLDKTMKGLRVGILSEYLNTKALSADVEKIFHIAIEELKLAGAQIVDVSVPLTEYAIPVYYLVASSEASSNLSRYDGVKYGHRADFKNLSAISLEDFYSRTRGEGFGAEVKRRIMLGTYCLSSGYYDAFYKKAGQVRRLLKQQFSKAFESCDVIISPVTTSPAFKIGSKSSDPLAMYLNDILTVSTNLTGLPGMSVPFGFSREHLPIGVQITANEFCEQTMLNTACFLEEASNVEKVVDDV